MNSPERTVLPAAEEFIARMIPGRRYRATELIALAGLASTHFQLLRDRALSRQLISCKKIKKRSLYIRPDGPAAIVPRACLLSGGELAGYDKQWKQFRALCEATRRR